MNVAGLLSNHIMLNHTVKNHPTLDSGCNRNTNCRSCIILTVWNSWIYDSFMLIQFLTYWGCDFNDREVDHIHKLK